MTNSIAKKILGPVFLLLSLLCAVPASASVILSCTGVLDAAISPGFTKVAVPQTISAQASILSSSFCTLIGTQVQPARLTITASFSSGSCASFALNPGTSMTITWDDDSTGTATYDPSSPSGFPLTGPFAANFLINSGHAAGRTMVISALPPVSAALVACLLPGTTPPVRHLGAQIGFSVL
ncbi:hypothetical protein [Pseudomonas gingeri]|uniref:hypothetical protein n=1 Tax=Pseudomonas gingeri TaxID=117681 RepID=UPI0015A48F21|nr:hypothetical protein [Pseudomonas gingeri]NWA10526.1 hypothetical protein [Pseudomonas gingeri]